MSIMEVHPEGDPVMRELGKNLTELQRERDYSLKYLERAVLRVLQDDDSPTHETIRQYHSGSGTASRANLGLIAALCVVYRVPMSEVSPEFARRASALAEVLTTSLEHIDRYMHQWCNQLQFGQAEGNAYWGDTCTPTKQYSTSTRAANATADSHLTRSAATAASSERSSEPSTLAA